MKKTKQVGLLFGALVAFTGQVFCQTNLQFTAVAVTDEHAIRLTWNSQSNEVYEIDEADALIDTNTGSITWNKLYDDYPSQGTNTFWLDTGNYILVPAISHPKDAPMRFYRIVDLGKDDLVGDEPTISIVSPTNGSVVSDLLTVTVTASADQGNLYPKLYVDGQAMRPSQDGSNYVLNTCEWGNGAHTLFATVDSSTVVDGPMTSSGVTGHGVSPFIGVTFSNLISRISFSQEFFQPSLGQTQQVSAVFAANCDWTLVIRDAFSNAVRTVTGSGTALSFNWDGSGDGGTNIPNGIYYYYISAQTNGLAPQGLVENNSSLSAASLSALQRKELYAVPTDGSGSPVPLALYPQGFDTNSLTIFSASESEIDSLYSDDAESAVAMDSGGSFSPDDMSTSSSQSSPPAPLRPPTPPCKGAVGKFGIAYQMYNANGTNPVLAAVILDNNVGLRSFVQMENHSGTTAQPFDPFKTVNFVAVNFATEMANGCWESTYFEHDDNLHLSDLQGSGTPFNDVDIGLLILHGVYGTSMDSTPGHPVKQMYFPIASGGSAQYLRMSDMNLGGSSPTNGLKWMAILACTSLFQQNWTSMMSQGVKPYNSNLHMILGTATDDSADPLIGQYWADFMLGDPSVGRKPMQIRLAWYNAAYYAYKAGNQDGIAYPNPTKFAVVADPSCINDTLQTNSLPTGGNWHYDSLQVYPSDNPPPTE